MKPKSKKIQRKEGKGLGLKKASTKTFKKAKQNKELKAEKTKTKKTSKKSDGPKLVVSAFEPLTSRSVPVGMLLLGCIKNIHDYELIIDLPYGLHGTIPITKISSTYTSMLQHLTQEGASEELLQNIHSLHDLFRVGQFVSCKVLEHPTGQKGKRNFKLTINPSDLCANISSTGLKNNMVLPGCVSSKEDHGYVMDIGVKGIYAFLKNKAAQKYIKTYNQGQDLMIGQHMPCVLQNMDTLGLMMGDSRMVNVAVDPVQIVKQQAPDSAQFNCLLPGMKVSASVDKLSDLSISVKILNIYSGGVHKSHLQHEPAEYSKKQQLPFTIIAVHPTTKVITLSELPHIMERKAQTFEGVAVGNIIEAAEVSKIDRTRGICVKLPDKRNGFAYTANLSDKENKEIPAIFKVGTSHRCRVIGFDFMASWVLLSFKESVLNRKFMSFSDIEVGEITECKVLKIVKGGVKVSLDSHMTGFIPSMHLFDTALNNPEKKFEEGQKLKCRILDVRPDVKKIRLTHKKSLVNTKLPVLTSFDQLKPGLMVEGFIGKILQNGVLVAFYNGIRGFVPSREISSEKIEYLDKLFYLGQVVKCRVLNWSSEEDRLTLSLKLSTKQNFGKRVEVPDDFEVGKLVDCQITKKTETGLDVKVLPSEVKAFIPTMHLSDHHDNCISLLNAYGVNDTIKDTMYYKQGTVLTLTRKPSLVKASKDGTLGKEFEQITPGMLLPGVVCSIKPYGVFVDMMHGLLGLAPNKFLHDNQSAVSECPYQIGQSVVAKVIEINQEKRRLLLSLRMSDCYHDDTQVGVDLLNTCMQERMCVKELMARRAGGVKSKLGHLCIGSVVSITVTDTTEQGILCSLPDKLKGFVTKQNMEGVSCVVGDQLEAVILYVDFVANCVELDATTELVKAVKHRKDNKHSQTKLDQVLKCEVHLIKESFILVSLKGHGLGKLAYLPAKKHLNDMTEFRKYEIGQHHSFVVKSHEGDDILGSLQMYEDKNKHENRSEHSGMIKKHKLKLGMIQEAVITEIHELQMNIKVGDVPGRVFVSEVKDEITEGCCPFEEYKVGDKIKVKIIGFREVKTHRYLPISHPNFTKALPDCTLKPSHLSKPGIEGLQDQTKKTYSVGDKVQVFVQKYNHPLLWVKVSPTVQGKVYVVNLSTDKKVLKNPSHHYHFGAGYNATVIGQKNDGLLDLVLAGVSIDIRPDAVMCGMIYSVAKNFGLDVHIPGGHRGRVAITDVDDEYTENPLQRFKEGSIVDCYVIDWDKDHERWNLSIRKSRLQGQIQSGKCDKEIVSFGDLKEDQVLRGFVNNCTAGGVFISLGRSITGRACFSHLSEHYIKDPASVYYPGKLVAVKILSISASSQHADLSLLEKDTGVPENIPHELKTNKRPHEEDSEMDDHEISKQDGALKAKTVGIKGNKRMKRKPT